jgi:hypothetical protein
LLGVCSLGAVCRPFVQISKILRGIGQAVQSGCPHCLEDSAKRAEAFLIGAVQATVSLAADGHEARLAQYCKMLGDVTEGHVETRGNVAGGSLLLPNESQNLAAPRLGNDLKGCDVAILVLVEIAHQAV